MPSAAPATRVRSTSRERRSSRRGDLLRPPGVLWGLPAALFFGAFAVLPLVIMVYLAFTTWSGIGTPQYVGGDNWSRLFADPAFVRSLRITAVLTVATVVSQVPLSLLVGVWAAGFQRGRAIVTAILFLPLLLSSAAIAVLWRSVLDPNYGVPYVLRSVLGGSGNVFGSQASAIAVLTLVSAWQYTPFHTLIFQGGARAIPPVLYEAATLDGAGRVRQFFSITLPQLRNSLMTSTILAVVGSMTTFDTILILTRGGPGGDTTNTAFYMYSVGFLSFDFGMGSAAAVILVALATLLSLVMVRMSGYDRMRSQQEGIL